MESDFCNPCEAPNISYLYIFTISVCPLGSSDHMIYTLSGFFLCIITIEPYFAKFRENYEKVDIFKRLTDISLKLDHFWQERSLSDRNKQENHSKQLETHNTSDLGMAAI